MKLEMNLAGDTLQLNLGIEESNFLYSFLEFFTRNRMNEVTKEEYNLADQIKGELKYFVE